MLWGHCHEVEEKMAVLTDLGVDLSRFDDVIMVGEGEMEMTHNFLV